MGRFVLILLRFLLVLGVISLVSCNKEAKNTRLLTRYDWNITSYIDYSANQEIAISPERISFFADGSLLKIRENDTLQGSWSLVDDTYLKLNLQTYKIAELSSKIMVLRYGNADFVYKSCRKE
ncbi:MAG: hypothetical protein HUK15_08675 [Bacteroidales bacterium]|nr:hypothetical protein [Bacteroidales bacterium]